VNSSVLALAGIASLFPSVADANTARAVALRGHFAFRDDIDVFRFPSAAPAHGDLATLDFTPSTDQGNAGVLWGRTLTLGLFVNRPPLFDDIRELGAIYAGVGAPPMHRLADVIAAWQADAHNAIGSLLGVGLGLQAVDRDVLGDARGRLSTGSRALAVDVGLGWSHVQDTVSNDLSLALTSNSFEQQDSGDTFAESAGPPSFALRDRLIWNREEGRALGAEALITRRSYGVDQPGATVSEGRYSRNLVQIDAGPHFGIGARVTLATALRLRYEALSGKVDDEDGPSILALGFPGAVVAMEARVFERWVARAGADYLLRYVQTEDGAGPLDPTQVRSTDSTFSWSLGLGYADSGFSLDAMLQSNFVLNGPDFVGGTAPGLFATLSGSYKWE